MTQPLPATTSFSVTYEGEAFAQHLMPVRDLAPALLALGQAFDRANSLLNPDAVSVTLNIRATEQASFGLDLALVQLWQEAIEFLSGDFVTSAANLKELLLGGAGARGATSLISLIKRLAGRKPKVIASTKDAVTLEIRGLKLSIPPKVFELYQDRPIREHLEAVTRPLTREGVDRVVFKEPGGPTETIEESDVEAFHVDETDEAATTETIIPRQRLKIASLSFQQGKWRLHDGERARWYRMTDADFVRSIEQGRRFGRDDLLVCEVLLTQKYDLDGNLALDYAVSRVLRHHEQPSQTRFPEDDDRLIP